MGDLCVSARDGRSYLVHVPEKAITDPKPGVALVMLLHGGGGHADLVFHSPKWGMLANSQGFVFVCPNGGGGRRFLSGRLLTWNAAPGYCGPGLSDDAGFLRSVIEHVQGHVTIDASRIFLTGHSNGAMMTYRMALSYPKLFRAIAPIAGACVNLHPLPSSQSAWRSQLPFACSEGSLSVPTLHIHSLTDPRALYPGGLGPAFPGTQHRILHPPVEDVFRAWARLNGCKEQWERLPVEFPATASHPDHSAALFSSPPIDSRKDSPTPMLFLQLKGPGHMWPGTEPGDLLRSIVGPSTDIIDATQQVCAFFARFATTMS